MKSTEGSPIAENLLVIHKIITRGLRVSISKCDEYISNGSIPTEETTGFSMYVTTLKQVTHAHHLGEDEIAFPYFNKIIDAPYDALKEDHNSIALLLDKIDQCLNEISNGGIDRLRDIMAEFEILWLKHIGIEEVNFSPKKIHDTIDINEQLKLMQMLSKHGRANSGPGPLILPFMIYNLKDGDREVFMSHLPWIINKVLVPHIWKSQWKPMSRYFM